MKRCFVLRRRSPTAIPDNPPQFSFSSCPSVSRPLPPPQKSFFSRPRLVRLRGSMYPGVPGILRVFARLSAGLFAPVPDSADALTGWPPGTCLTRARCRLLPTPHDVESNHAPVSSDLFQSSRNRTGLLEPHGRRGLPAQHMRADPVCGISRPKPVNLYNVLTIAFSLSESSHFSAAALSAAALSAAARSSAFLHDSKNPAP